MHKFKPFIAVIGMIVILLLVLSINKVPSIPFLTPGPTPTPDLTIDLKPTTNVQTGGIVGSLEQYLQANPQVQKEADLKAVVPIQKEGFTVDYSYGTARFTVNIQAPHAENRVKFEKWAKEKGLQDLKNFDITNL